MKKRNLLLTFLASVLFVSMSFAQGTISGTVLDASYGESLIGAAILVQGTTTGTTTDINGQFIFDLDAGSYSLDVSFIGYDSKTVEVTVTDGQVTRLGKIRLTPSSTLLDAVNIIADRAKERETPVAVSNISKADLEQKLGSQDLPMIMNATPSVYATPQGGGAGDARINVRGFNQRNVAIMINGVPVNDMENGWVYWSNWDGIADATSSIQMQRGLSAVNLATPSVGGTMNIITSPAEMRSGFTAKFEAGSGSFYKATLTGHTGLIDEKFALSAAVVKKVGQGVIDKTWTDSYAYYLGLSYNIHKNHRLEAYAVGAPQRHGQNLYKQNAASYDSTFAREIGIDDSTIMAYQQSDRGRLYNENWGPVDENYDGQQSWNQNDPRDRHKSGFINERENFFHKPLANLNWYAQWSDKISQFTTFYYSGGKGGGTGTLGKIQYDYDGPSRTPDWNSTIEHNLDPDYTRQGILRNSVNNQWTVGLISKAKIDITDAFKMQVGIDWRTAKIDHFREVRDLLGLTSYEDVDYNGNPSSDFYVGDGVNRVLGEKIAYNFTNTVDWAGAFVQAEYKTQVISIYGTLGYSMIKYGFTDHFATQDTLADGNPDVNSGELTAESLWIKGFQFKAGINYNVSETFNIFGNYGYVSKVPIFDNVIEDSDGTVAQNTQNEKFKSYELGVNYNSLNDKFHITGNFYFTDWQDRTFTRNVRLDEEGNNGIAYIKGMNQRHVGFEVDAKYRPLRVFGVGAIASIAQWQYLNDVDATIKDEANNVVFDEEIYVEGLMVGDAPQTQFGLYVDIYPIKGMSIQLLGRLNANHYADFDPTTRTDETDRDQVWKTPSYTVFDAHFNYDLPIKGRVGVAIFVHVFNIANTFYIQDAVDNSAYNGFYGYDDRFSHTANSAEVFLGMPRMFNGGLKIKFH